MEWALLVTSVWDTDQVVHFICLEVIMVTGFEVVLLGSTLFHPEDFLLPCNPACPSLSFGTHKWDRVAVTNEIGWQLRAVKSPVKACYIPLEGFGFRDRRDLCMKLLAKLQNTPSLEYSDTLNSSKFITRNLQLTMFSAWTITGIEEILQFHLTQLF